MIFDETQVDEMEIAHRDMERLKKWGLGFDNPTEEEIMSFFEGIYFENFAEDDHR